MEGNRMAPTGRCYKVRLSSGRVLGPLDIERVHLLIFKNKIIGNELARECPDGEWKDINLIPELSELLIAKIEGRLQRIELQDVESENGGYDPIRAPKEPDPTTPKPAKVEAVPGIPLVFESDKGTPEDDFIRLDTKELEEAKQSDSHDRRDGRIVNIDQAEGATRIDAQDETEEEQEDKTDVGGYTEEFPSENTRTRVEENLPDLAVAAALPVRSISQEKTVVFQRASITLAQAGKPKERRKGGGLRSILVALLLVFVAYDFLFPEVETTPQRVVKWQPIRPRMPTYIEGKPDPNKSERFYREAMGYYVRDTVDGYRAASDKLLLAAGYDISNVKALAMLASCYLNVIDSSSKDENYFAVIRNLIDQSRSKAVDIPETVISDVEFYVTVNRAETAENRIVEYTKLHPGFAKELFWFYYLGYVYYHRGDLKNAAHYLSLIPDDKAFSPKVFYYRGLIAEHWKDMSAAQREYEKALRLNKDHARSRLRISDIFASQGKLKEAASHLEFIAHNPRLLPPKELALGYYLHSQLSELHQKWEIALGDVERAVRLDRENHDYLLRLYELRVKVGDSALGMRDDARMYFFLSEGEKLLKEGRRPEALIKFMQAKQYNTKSPLPLLKMGDMFYHMNEIGNAQDNYRLAAEKAPNDISVWSKYINTLIQSYEWEEAERAMNRFRGLPVSQSAIDKAAGDMYARQGRHAEAQAFYKKAMARETIDPDVYIAYARSLMKSGGFKNAPFFFSLALRFDPLNIDALVGIAGCIAETDSIERAIRMLQDELQKRTASKAELLAAIAELQIRRGEWDLAEQYVDQARAVNPDYAYPWKIQAKIYMNRVGLDKTALDKALAAYKSYSERNLSDPSGYLERYSIFKAKAEFEKAYEELTEVYRLYPKYPRVHYFLGDLYAKQGNHIVAAEEFKLEMSNNPRDVENVLALGRALIELQRVAEALGHFNKAMQLAPTAAEPKHLAGYANYLTKNYPAAIALLNAALAKDKGNPLIYRRLGMAYKQIGDMNSARRAFRKYLDVDPEATDREEIQQFL
jgi:tetratricopeptide (TPR) repeat protein